MTVPPDVRDHPSKFPLLALGALAILIYAINLTMIGTPVFGSDEYAFLISGRYIGDLRHLYALDPSLQPISNFVFFEFIHELFRLSSDDFVPLFRVVHLAEYALTLLVVYRTFAGVFRDGDLRRGTALLLLMPSTIYLYAVMPEVELALMTACVGYALLVFFPRRQWLGSILSGVLLAIAILIKPHAVATLLAAIAYVFVAPLILDRSRWLLRAIRNPLSLVAVAYLSAVALWRLTSGSWQFGPRTLMGFGFYGEYLQTAAGSPTLPSKLWAACDYALGHIMVLGLLFAPCLVFIAGTIARWVRDREAAFAVRGRDELLGSLLIFVLLLFHVVMISWFTAGVAQMNEGEAMRLHGRYLGPVFLFLCAIFFHALTHLRRREVIAARVLVGLCLLACMSYVFSRFKLFPWDYPLAFGFFRVPNFYRWDFSGNAQAIGWLMMALSIAVVLTAIVWKPLFRVALSTLLVAACLAGNIQTFAWTYRHTADDRELAVYSRMVRTMVEHQPYGTGLVIADNRYGSASAVLFNLANAPRVLVKEANSVISESDVKDASWVLLAAPYTIAFDDLHMVVLGPFRFFPRDTGLSFKEYEKPLLQPGKSVRLLLGANSYAPGRLVGFNVQEPWGSWTSQRHAAIELPVKLHGKVKVRLFGWTLPENLGTPLVIKIGDATQSLQLTGLGANYEFDVDISGEVGQLTLDSEATRPPTWGRVLGTAIGSISFEAS